MIGTMEHFDVDNGNFVDYEERMANFLKVNKITDDQTKAEYFIILAGPEIYTIMKSLSIPKPPKELKYGEIVQMLTAHFAPKINKRVERFKFMQAVQEDGETITSFIVKLKSLAQTCKYGNYLDDALSDKFIVGLKSSSIQQELLSKADENFSTYCELALNMEMSAKETKAIHKSSQSQLSINSYSQGQSKVSQATNYQRNRSQSRSQGQSNNRNRSPSPNSSRSSSHSYRGKSYTKHLCSRCGVKNHNPNQCPAKQWRCYNCNRYGHTSFVCRNKVKVINAVKQVDQSCIMQLKVEGKLMAMEVDTGACVTVISIDKYHKSFSHLEIQDYINKFTTVTGESIKILGKINVTVEHIHEKYKLELVVIDAIKDFNPLIGRSWLNILKPEWKQFFEESSFRTQTVNTITNHINKNIFLQYPNIIPNPEYDHPIENYSVEILLEDEVKPVFHCAYSVPFKIREEVEKELERLLKKNIIEPVKYAKWASPIVVVVKPQKSVRICVDFKVTINKFLKSEHYPIPRIDDIFASLAKCTYFCVIDLTGAYQQLIVSESSRELLTINTHKGLFRYTRLPFGLKTAPAIFQSIMDQILSGLNNVSCYLDDILIGGKTKQDCESNLHKVLSRLNEYKVKINLEKSKLLEQKVSYLGHVISEQGISPNPEKITAIVNASIPKSISQLQAYLGLLNYYGKFIPNLSIELRDLYHLLKKDEKFEWTESSQKCFENSKQLILRNKLLEMYDSEKPIVIAADASPYGVGAVLSHIVNGQEKPVFFASSTLSPAEQNYSQLHREALAIMYAVKKFHKYIFGLPFKIYSDHQALREIFNPKKSTPSVAAARLQRWAVILSMYDYQIEYRPGNKMGNVDALSRLPNQLSTNIEVDLINYFNFSDKFPINFEKIEEATKTDQILSQVYDFVKYSWPNRITEIPSEVKEYYGKRLYLSCENNCLLYMSRVIIPKSLKFEVLKLLHENHLGIVKMKMVARSYVWWQGIDKDLEKLVSECVVCQQTQNRKKEVIESSWPEANYPFERIHIDFLHFQKYTFLLIIDAYSKYLDVILMSKTNATSLIDKLVKLFSIFGLPTTIVSDNGPPFGSREFTDFARKHNICLLKSPPYNPQSNGLAERNVQSVKKVLYKTLLDPELKNLTIEQRVDKFLLHHRNTPSMSTSKSPSELIFAFKPRILIDLLHRKKVVSFDLNCNSKEKSQNCKNNDTLNYKLGKSYYKNFKKGEKVMFLSEFGNYLKWIPARIVKKVSAVTYIVQLTNSTRFCHQNKLRMSTLHDKYHPGKPIIDTSHYENNKENETQTNVPAPEQYNKRRSLSDSAITIRRSGRERRSPQRLMYK